MKYKSSKKEDKYSEYSYGRGSERHAPAPKTKGAQAQPAFRTYRSPEYSAYVYDKNGVYTGRPVIKKRPRKVSAGKLIAGVAAIVAASFLVVWLAFYLILRPNITVVGGERVTVNAGSEYYDEGATGRFLGRDITYQLTTSGLDEIDTSIIGVYEVDYTYKLRAFDMTFTARRYVRVTDEEPPALRLLGGDEMKVAKGGKFIEPGYAASDNLDGDISESVEVSGFVDTNRAGSYDLIYSAADSNGNMATVLRTVVVPETPPTEAGLTEFSLEGYFPSAILRETPDAGNEYVAETVFFGDSFVDALAESGLISVSQTWWYDDVSAANALENPLDAGGTPTNKTVIDLLGETQPKRLVMMVGSEDVSSREASEFIKAYSELVISVMTTSPDTTVIVSGLTPVVSDYDERSSGRITNQKINIFNYYLAQMCAELGVYFLDAGSAMKDYATGAAREDYVESYRQSGMYFTEAGSSVYMNYLRGRSVNEQD